MRTAIALALCLMELPAQEWKLTPVRVGAGPLLFVTMPDESSGERRDAQCVVWPDGGTGVQPFLRAKGRLLIQKRLSDTSLLVAFHGEDRGLWILDLLVGERRLLTPCVAVLCVEEDRVWVHEDSIIVSIDFHERATRRVLSKRKFQSVLGLDSRGAVGVTSEAPASIRVLSLDGTKDRHAHTLGKDDEHGWFLSTEISPFGDALGIGHRTDERGYELRVVALESGKELMSLPKLSMDVNPLSSSMPRVEFVWLDDQRIRFSETVVESSGSGMPLSGSFQWVDVEVPSGKRLASHRYSDLELHHQKPPLTITPLRDRSQLGHFEKETGRLFYAGEKEPIIDLRNKHGHEVWGSITVSKDGRFATLMSDEQGAIRLDLVDGRKKTRWRLISEWCFEPRWF